MRRAIRRFAELMEERMKRNDHKSGWDTATNTWLWQRAFDEMLELRDEMSKARSRSPIQIAREAADVANFVMMLADNEVPALEETW